MAAETQKELEQLKKRFLDLAEKSYRQNVFAFTGFLSLAEQNALQEAMGKNAFCPFSLWGGNEDCERRMARFGSAEELGYEEDFPIAALRISPLSEKFSEDFSHRDFLGALMHLENRPEHSGRYFSGGKAGMDFLHGNHCPFYL